jgi:hypothetical protein
MSISFSSKFGSAMTIFFVKVSEHTLVTPHFLCTLMDKDLIDFNKATPAGLISLKLPAFWIDKPVSWSVLAESQFRLHGIHREQTRYGYLLSALTKEAVSLIPDVVKHPPEHHPYSALKQSLLDSHELTDYQKIAALHKMELLMAVRAAGLHAGALSSRPQNFHLLHASFPGETSH